MFLGNARSQLKPSQCVVSFNLEEICLNLIQDESFRKSADKINRLLHRDGDKSLSHTTLKDRTEAFGHRIAREQYEQACKILPTYKVNPKTGVPDSDSVLPEEVCRPILSPSYDKMQAKGIIKTYNEGRRESEAIKDADKVRQVERDQLECVYISVDDIGVKHQKEKRGANTARKKKYVENTVIHVESREGQYTLTAIGMRNAFILLMAYLLNNRLMENRRLVFLTDGAVVIREYIQMFFCFRQHTIILDWLHLEKKCKELLSMAVREPKQEKGNIRTALNRMLWAGNTHDAIVFLENIEAGKVKNKKALEDVIDYLRRKEPYVACYALRKETGLRVSSNRVEKANDLVVAGRQKHNGMSWSKYGSGALAAITAAKVNGEIGRYIKHESPNFMPVAA